MQIVHNIIYIDEVTGKCKDCDVIFHDSHVLDELIKDQDYHFCIENNIKHDYIKCNEKQFVYEG